MTTDEKKIWIELCHEGNQHFIMLLVPVRCIAEMTAVKKDGIYYFYSGMNRSGSARFTRGEEPYDVSSINNKDI